MEWTGQAGDILSERFIHKLPLIITTGNVLTLMYIEVRMSRVSSAQTFSGKGHIFYGPIGFPLSRNPRSTILRGNPRSSEMSRQGVDDTTIHHAIC